MVDRQHIEPGDRQIIAELLRRIEAARRFPHNTDPCVRHVEIMGESLCRGLPYPMLDEERGHCAISLLSVVAALYEARNAGVGAVQTPGMPAKLPGVTVALNMCMQANIEAKLPVPMCWDLALYVKRLEDASADVVTPAQGATHD